MPRHSIEGRRNANAGACGPHDAIAWFAWSFKIANAPGLQSAAAVPPTSSRRRRSLRIEELPRPIRPHAAARLFADQAYGALLENPGEPTRLGRYSFLGIDPFWVLRGRRNASEGGPPGRLRPLPGDPLHELGALLDRHRGADGEPETRARSGLPPLLGGALGYLSYELLYLLEEVPDLGRDDLPVPDLYVVCYGTILATDGLEGRSWLASNGFGDSPAEAERQADQRMRDALARLAGLGAGADEEEARAREEQRRWQAERARQLDARPRLSPQDVTDRGIRPVMARDAYLALVAQAREHILAGDIFEVCTAQRFDAEVAARSRPDLYRVLCGVSPAPFAASLRYPELEVASSSPERFLRLGHDRIARTRPIKGTRPRGATPEEDARLAAELQGSEKDRAENLMIVDLARNDLGRVCTFGSVRVPRLLTVESYPFTHQLVSTVRGQLRPDADGMDLLRAAFPGGSMTGAPKVEAMKIIDRLEPVKRGVFAGAIGYFDFDGAFDLSIAIRTLVEQGERVTFHVGGAIVADSDPAEEYQETLDKAHGLVMALDLARREDRR
jgi:para-aminobenzoate synthetase component 1